MTRVYWSGAEQGNLSEITSSGTTGSASVGAVTTIKRSGAYSYRISYSAGNGYIRIDYTAAGEYYFRIAYYTEATNNNQDAIQFRKGTTTLASMRVDHVNNKYQLVIGSSVVATGTMLYTPSTWFLFEFRLKIDNSAGVFTLKVDGVVDADFTGDTQPGADTTIDNLYLTVSHSLNGCDSYFDDIAINDTNGSVDNSWCGDGYILFEQKPTAAGDVTQLTPSAGDNWAAVDEIPHDSDITYVESGTADQYDLYNVANTTIPDGSTISRVRVQAIAKDTVADGGKIKLGVKTNGNEYWSDDIALTTNYTAENGTEYTTNPNTSAAWTKEELNNLQVGAKVRGA